MHCQVKGIEMPQNKITNDVWNKFIAYDDLLAGKAVHHLEEPDSLLGKKLDYTLYRLMSESTDADKFWESIADKLRRVKGFCPMTPQEAEDALSKIPKRPLPEEEIDSIINAVLHGELNRCIQLYV